MSATVPERALPANKSTAKGRDAYGLSQVLAQRQFHAPAEVGNEVPFEEGEAEPTVGGSGSWLWLWGMPVLVPICPLGNFSQTRVWCE